MKIVHKVINSILDYIMTNTYTFIQLKSDLREWRNKDELFDLDIIDKESHRQVIEKLKQAWFSMYLTQEEKWREKGKEYKDQLAQA
jgi:hypothetical protein